MVHVVRFITTFAISAHHHYSCEFESLSCRGALDPGPPMQGGPPVQGPPQMRGGGNQMGGRMRGN
jgi:hypothetical protein